MSVLILAGKYCLECLPPLVPLGITRIIKSILITSAIRQLNERTDRIASAAPSYGENSAKRQPRWEANVSASACDTPASPSPSSIAAIIAA